MTARTWSDEERLARAREVILQESQAVRVLADGLGESFSRAVDLILECRGKLVLTGVGKSGLICKKIAATFASTGTPAFFLHAADGLHGDMGMVARDDVVVALSYSGETQEILRLVPLLQRQGNPLVCLTGRSGSELASLADVVLVLGPLEEACVLGLAPTTSTTVSLVMGDALAVVVQEIRGFREDDFAKIHPAGSLGRRLLRVEEIMHGGEELPLITAETTLKDALFYISATGLGVTTVVDGEGLLLGILTDGDLRRAMERGPEVLDLPVEGFMTTHPKLIRRSTLVARALRKMERYTITALVVTDGKDRPLGILKLQDIIKTGLM